MPIEATTKLNQLHALLMALTGPDGLDHVQGEQSSWLLHLALELTTDVRESLAAHPATT